MNIPSKLYGPGQLKLFASTITYQIRPFLPITAGPMHPRAVPCQFGRRPKLTCCTMLHTWSPTPLETGHWHLSVSQKCPRYQYCRASAIPIFILAVHSCVIISCHYSAFIAICALFEPYSIWLISSFQVGTDFPDMWEMNNIAREMPMRPIMPFASRPRNSGTYSYIKKTLSYMGYLGWSSSWHTSPPNPPRIL